MQLQGHDIGVCSWSLQPKDLADLVEQVKRLGLTHIQLALTPILFLDDKQKFRELTHLANAGMTLTGGMMAFPGEDYSSIDAIRRTGGFVPNDQWPLRKRLAAQGAKLAAELGMKAIGTHVGFVPRPGEGGYDEMLARVREVAGAFARSGIDLHMETGQEPAEELLHFLRDLNAPNVAINFDPANMILYGAGDPIEAIDLLGQHVRHVHVKDATASSEPGKAWGEEVPFGSGQVGAKRFVDALKRAGYTGPLVIEREAGTDRLGDVQKAIDTLRQLA